MIFAQAKRAVARLNEEEQADVYFVAVTLDPENDSVEGLAKLAQGQGLAAPAFNLVTGDSLEVNKTLNRMGIERYRDELGVIQHTNMFMVIDRAGTVAYRFSLGDLQEDWLVEALKLVCAEPEPSHDP
ncbi:MAG: SCO family protein [Planctomycetes bacterium]|nr:SCO family protein [Planctomycetota bacterium]